MTTYRVQLGSDGGLDITAKRPRRTKYYRETMATTRDEERVVSLSEARALPGVLGPIAAAMLSVHGVYGYTLHPSGCRVRLVLA